MEIDINQKKISIGDKYQIYIDGSQTHNASRQVFQLLPEIVLFKNGDGRPRMTINKQPSFLREKYDITRWDNNILEFREVSLWKPYYKCQCGDDLYEIYGNRGRKFSVYKNSMQVARWSKNMVTWFAGDNYKIIADKDCDTDLLISLCLTIDNISSSSQEGNTINIDIGNIIVAKKFDENWQPKN